MRMFSESLARAVGALLATLLALLVLLSTAETLAWTFFEVSWPETSEIEGILLIWFALLGAVYGVERRIHLGVEILTRRLPEKLRDGLGGTG